MKRVILIIALMLSFIMVNGQTDEITLLKSKDIELDVKIAELRTSVESAKSIQYCLGEYWHARRIGYTQEVASVGLSTVGLILIYYGNEDSALVSELIFAAAGGLAISGCITLLRAEKWLKKASVEISPTGVRVNF